MSVSRTHQYSPSFQHSISSLDGWPVREDHSDIRGYAESLCDGIQGELGYSFGTYGVRLNNNYQASIDMAPFEALYGRKCRTPVCWDEVGERRLVGPELVQITSEKVKVVRDNLKIARDRQKSYADNRRRDFQFERGDRVFLKISP